MLRCNERIVLTRLREIAPALIIELMNDSRVRRHLPLATGDFGPAECTAFVLSKEKMWTEHGYGPWAIVIDGNFAGWGGLQPEGSDVDVGLVLHPSHWGEGQHLYRRFIGYAFEKLGQDSVITLLPQSRRNVGAIFRLGFRRDGGMVLDGVRFRRYRLTSQDWAVSRSNSGSR